MSKFPTPLEPTLVTLREMRSRTRQTGPLAEFEDRRFAQHALADAIDPVEKLGRAIALGETISGCGGRAITDFAIGLGETMLEAFDRGSTTFISGYTAGVRTVCTLMAEMLRQTRAFPTASFFDVMWSEAEDIAPAARQVLKIAWESGACALTTGKAGTAPEPMAVTAIPGNILGPRTRGLLPAAKVCVFASRRPHPEQSRRIIDAIGSDQPAIFCSSWPDRNLAEIVSRVSLAGQEVYAVSTAADAIAERYGPALERLGDQPDAIVTTADVAINDAGAFVFDVVGRTQPQPLRGLSIDPEHYAAIEPIHRRRQSVAAHGYLHAQQIRRAMDAIRPVAATLPEAQRRGALACMAEFDKIDWMQGRSYAPVQMVTRALHQIPSALLDDVQSGRGPEHAETLSYGVGGTPTPLPEPPVATQQQKRVLDVSVSPLSGTTHLPPLTVGAQFNVIAIIRLLGSPIIGLDGGSFDLAPGGQIEFRADTKGCRLLTRSMFRVDVPDNEDSVPATFIFEVENAHDCQVILDLYQDGKLLYQCLLDKTALAGALQRHELQPAADVELGLSVRARDYMIEADSPHQHFNLSGVEFGTLRPMSPGLTRELRRILLGLQQAKVDPVSADKELRVIGSQLAALLPPGLIEFLRQRAPAAIYLRHDVELDFPFELAPISGDDDEYFLGDRIPICRWYKNIKAAPPQDARAIARAAVLQGNTSFAASDYQVLAGKCHADAFSSPDQVYTDVFETAEYGLLHFIGHCEGSDEYDAALVLKSGRLRMNRVGTLREERKFGEAAPMVMLNGCATASAYIALSGPKSFPFQFLSTNARAFIGTLWPVHETVAHHFSTVFYDQLNDWSLSEALCRTKETVAAATKDVDGQELNDWQRSLRRISVRSYCAYGHPNTQIRFTAPAGAAMTPTPAPGGQYAD